MKILVARKGSGKTAGCVDYLRRNPHAYLVVHSAAEVLRVRQQYTRNEFALGRRILSYDEVSCTGWNQGRQVSGLVIDNADLILERIFEYPVEALAITWPDEVRR